MMRRLAALALAPALAALGACIPAGAVTLAEGGNSDYRIVVAEDAPPVLHRAARSLSMHLAEATGATFPIVDDAHDGPAIRLRRADGVDMPPDHPQAYRIGIVNDDLVLAGNSGQAVFLAVHRFLEREVGVHWFEPGHTDIPRRDTLKVTTDGRWRSPRFTYREVFFRHSDDPLFAARNALNGRFGHRLSRRIPEDLGGDRPLRKIGIFDLVPPESYRDSHPEYYAGGQLRFAHDGVRQAAKQHLRQRLSDWDTAPAYLLIEHADRGTYFRGGADGKLIDRHGAPGTAYFDFVRELAAVVAETHPDVVVMAQAYLWSRTPPRDMALPENMGVMLAGIERDFSKPLTAPANGDFLADLDGWNEIAEHVVIWDYVTNFGGYIQPHPDINTYAENLRALAARRSVEGVFAQGAYNTPGAAFAELRTWLLARLLWDPTRDADALIDTFMDGFYGPAAPYLGDYLDALTAAGRRWSGKLRAKTPPTAGYLDGAFLRQADRLFEQAVAATGGRSPYLQRVRRARIAVDYAVLANRAALRAQGDASWIDTDRRLQRLERNLDRAGVTAYREGGGADVESLMASLAIDRGRATPPAICDGVAEDRCHVVEDLSLHLVGGGAKLTPDEPAADGAAAELPGDSRAWGIQLPLADLLPESGEWRIHARLRVTTRPGNDAPAIQVGVHRGGNTTVAASAEYRTIALPGTYRYDAKRYVWFASAHRDSVRRLLVDRVIAIPAEEGAR